MNVNVGFRAMAQFGKNALHGVGIGESAAMMYAGTFKNAPRLSYGAGLYMDNVNWGSSTSRSVGLTAMLGYKISERWNAFLYGQKNIVNSNTFTQPYYLRANELAKDAVGAAIRYNVAPGSYIQMNIEYNRIPTNNLIPIPMTPSGKPYPEH